MFQATGLAVVETTRRAFHINQCGKPQYGVRFKKVGPFSEGLAPVEDLNGQSFHITLAGEPAYQGHFEEVMPFHGGMAPVRKKYGKWLFIGRDGKSVELGLYDEVSAFNADRWHVSRVGKKTKKWVTGRRHYYIDLGGNRFLLDGTPA
jgi:hypothetical protein